MPLRVSPSGKRDFSVRIQFSVNALQCILASVVLLLALLQWPPNQILTPHSSPLLERVGLLGVVVERLMHHPGDSFAANGKSNEDCDVVQQTLCVFLRAVKRVNPAYNVLLLDAWKENWALNSCVNSSSIALEVPRHGIRRNERAQRACHASSTQGFLGIEYRTAHEISSDAILTKTPAGQWRKFRRTPRELTGRFPTAAVTEFHPVIL